MLRGFVAASATVLVATAPAQAEVILQQSGLVDHSVPLTSFGENPGRYRIVFRADGAENSIPSLRLYEGWNYSYYDNGTLVDSGDTIMEFTPSGGALIRSANYLQIDYKAPTFRDFRDEQLTGLYVDVSFRMSSVNIFMYLDKPVPYRLTVERFDLASVPEPASWELMIAGFAVAGAAARRSRSLGQGVLR